MLRPSQDHHVITCERRKVVNLWLEANGNDVAMVDDPALWFEGEIRKALRQQGHVLTDSDVNELAKRAGSALGRDGAKDTRVCTQSKESCLVIELVESGERPPFISRLRVAMILDSVAGRVPQALRDSRASCPYTRGK